MALSVPQLATALRLTATPQDEVPAEYADILARLLAVSEAIVEEYAPAAPEAIRDEAQIRLSGYLFDRPPETPSAGAMYHSGAQGLLAPYHRPPVALSEEAASDAVLRDAILALIKDYAAKGGRAIELIDLSEAARANLPPAGGDAGDVLTREATETFRIAVIPKMVYEGRRTMSAVLAHPAEFTIASNTGRFTLPNPMPMRGGYVLIALPATAPDLTAINVGGFNQIAAFSKKDAMVTLGGVVHKCYVSNRAWSTRSAGTLFALSPALRGAAQWEAPKGGASAPAAGSIMLAMLAAEVLARMAPDLTGNASKYLAVNAGANAVELVDAPSAPTIGDGSVDTDQLADEAVTSAKLADGAVTGVKLPDGVVTSLKIAARAVTNAEIGEDAVTEAEIADGAIKTAKVEAKAITLAKIADAVVARMAPAYNNAQGSMLLAANASGTALEFIANTVGDGTITLGKLVPAALARMAPALAGNAGKHLAVNAGANAVELVDLPGIANKGVGIAQLADAVVARIAPALAGNGGKFLAVNSAANAVELVDEPTGTAGSVTRTELASVVLAQNANGGSSATFSNIAPANIAAQAFFQLEMPNNAFSALSPTLNGNVPATVFAMSGVWEVARCDFDEYADPTNTGQRQVDAFFPKVALPAAAASRTFKLWGIR